MRAAARLLRGGAGLPAVPLQLSRSVWTSVETPNPKVRKFEWLSGGGEHSADLPAARSQLLVVDGVRDVFLVNGGTEPWLSVTRADDAAWDSLEPQVHALLEAMPGAGAAEAVPDASSGEASETTEHSGIMLEIEEVLEHRIRPSVQADGGDVELIRFEPADGCVTLRLKGACRGCPQSAVTLQENILRTLRFFVEGVKIVVAEEEELDEDAANDPYADIPWDHIGEPVRSLQPPAKNLKELADAGTPIFSTFAGMKVPDRMLKRVQFMSLVELKGRTPQHILVKCGECKARRTIEDPQDILRKDKGNTVGNAAVVICPSCCVFITQ